MGISMVIVTNKGGKWRVCVDYRELNKATKKDHFPLPFIEKVLYALAGNNLLSFLDGLSGYNQSQIHPPEGPASKLLLKQLFRGYSSCCLPALFYIMDGLPPIYYY